MKKIFSIRILSVRSLKCMYWYKVIAGKLITSRKGKEKKRKEEKRAYCWWGKPIALYKKKAPNPFLGVKKKAINIHKNWNWGKEERERWCEMRGVGAFLHKLPFKSPTPSLPFTSNSLSCNLLFLSLFNFSSSEVILLFVISWFQEAVFWVMVGI